MERPWKQLREAFGLRLPLLNVAPETTRNIIQNQLQIPAVKLAKRCLPHREAACHRETDLAFGLQLPLLNSRSKAPCREGTDQAFGLRLLLHNVAV